MVWFYEQKACLFWCCANGLPLTPFTLLFPCNTSAHKHLPPTLHTSTLFIYSWVEECWEKYHASNSTHFFPVYRTDGRWRRHWKMTQVGLLTALFFSLPWERANRRKKCKRKHKRLSKKTHMQFYLKCKNEKLNSYTDSFQKALINTV